MLPHVLTPEDALAPGAPAIHPGGNLRAGSPMILERGDAGRGFAEADRVFAAAYRTQSHSPAGMEPRAALAAWEGDRLTIWKTSRAVHAVDQPRLARVFGLPLHHVRVLCTAMGGGFGNKDESRISYLAALLARKAGRPVRLESQRDEEFVAGRSRQESRTQIKIGVRGDGSLTAVEARTLVGGGAYVATGMRVVRRAGQGPIYLYTCPNVRFEGNAAYTNRPPARSGGWAGPWATLPWSAWWTRSPTPWGWTRWTTGCATTCARRGSRGRGARRPANPSPTSRWRGAVPSPATARGNAWRRGGGPPPPGAGGGHAPA